MTWNPVYYFGAGTRERTAEGVRWRSGHFLFGPGLRRAEEPRGWPRSLSFFVPGGKIDAKFAPRLPARYGRDGEEAPEGHAALHHVEGWTLLSFWDRSGDSRPNSNSTFAMQGTHDFPAAVEAARATFPELWARFPFEVVPV